MSKRRASRVVSVVAGARPNFVKVAPLLRAFDARWPGNVHFVNTGQHYDDAMSLSFFRDLGIRQPDKNLGVGSGSHAEQTARLLIGLEATFREVRPQRVVVVGDVNSTAAAALAASKLDIPVDHVEAGLRSFDRTMPEEINRLITDAISDHLFVSEPSGLRNLLREGHRRESVHMVGNVMIDTLVRALPLARQRGAFSRLGYSAQGFGVVTLHRPSNVDDLPSLRRVMLELTRTSTKWPLVFPAHPRTSERITSMRLKGSPRLRILPPQGYVDFLSLVLGARFVITDSGGVQEETTFLGIPCLTLRNTTERPITVAEGTNTLVGDNPKRLRPLLDATLSAHPTPRKRPRLWDGRAAERIAKIIDTLL